MTVGSFNSVIPSTLSIRTNGATGNKCDNSCQQRARTLDSKFKSAPPQKCFLNKTAPRTQAGGPTISGRGVLNGAQTNPCKKIAAEDRRYFILIPYFCKLRWLGKLTIRSAKVRKWVINNGSWVILAITLKNSKQILRLDRTGWRLFSVIFCMLEIIYFLVLF